jgi:flagellar hook-associated protein 2
MVDKVQTFVDTYNEAQTFFNVQSVYNADLDIIGPFSGESGLRRVMEGLSTMISASYDTGDGLEGLGQLGIATQKGGTLELDADALRTSLVDNYDAIEGFFTSDDGPLKTLQTRIEDVYVATETGTLESRKDSLEGSVRDLEDSILRQEAYVDSYSERLRKKFTAMEGVMAAMQTQASFLSAMLVTPAS